MFFVVIFGLYMFRFLNALPAPAWARVFLGGGSLFFAAALALGATLPLLAVHGLALLPNGQLAAWGANEFAQVQAGQSDFVRAPVRLSLPGTKATALAVGSRHSLAVDEAGRVWAWGDNSSGQLGLGHTRPVSAMSVLAGLPARALLVVAGSQHSAALLADGTVWAWGANNRGQLGSGAVAGLNALAVRTKPVRVTTLGRVLGLAGGSDFVLALVGQRDRNGTLTAAVWSWGAGNGLPHRVDGIEGAEAVRAAGEVAMARTATGGYWQWRAEQSAPGIAQRSAFERLGEMTHPLLAALTPLPADNPPRAAGTGGAAGNTGGDTTGRDSAARDTATRDSAANSATGVARPSLSTAAAPGIALTPIPVPTPTPTPTAAPAPAPAASSTPTPTRVAVPSLPAATALSVPPSAGLSVRGTVRLSSGFGGDSAAGAGQPLENVQVLAEGAQCSPTDNQGRYVCSVAAGWSGRVSLKRNNYRFSPSALAFQNLRADAGQQDFAAIYDPR